VLGLATTPASKLCDKVQMSKYALAGKVHYQYLLPPPPPSIVPFFLILYFNIYLILNLSL